MSSLASSSESSSHIVNESSTSSSLVSNSEGTSAPANTVSVMKLGVAFRAVGSATPLKHNKFKLDGNKTVADVEKYLRKALNYDKGLFLYCGSGFSPTPDQTLQGLHDCFQIGSELTISYGFQETWG